MKALSTKQPYGGWIAEKKKPIETRTWQTFYRGDLLIVSSKQWHDDYKGKKFQSRLVNLLGYALCVARLHKITKMTKEDEPKAMCKLYPGAYSWHFDNIRLVEPFPVHGRLNLFNVTLPENFKIYDQYGQIIKDYKDTAPTSISKKDNPNNASNIVQLPNTLEDAIEFYFPRFAGMDKYFHFSEDKFSAFCHSMFSGGIGMKIRNEMGFWTKNSALYTYMTNELKLQDPDSMSDAIIRGVYRKFHEQAVSAEYIDLASKKTDTDIAEYWINLISQGGTK